MTQLTGPLRSCREFPEETAECLHPIRQSDPVSRTRCVLRRATAALSPSGIQKFGESIRGRIEVRDDLPRNSNGRMDRAELGRLYRDCFAA